jgi:hypothetical protein
MPPTIEPQALDTPDLRLGFLEIWIQDREFPHSTDSWDANWLRVIVRCQMQLATVWKSGPILHLRELREWIEDSDRMYKTLAGEAKLACMEPALDVLMRIDKVGHIEVRVTISSDSMQEQHLLYFEIDQSYLPDFINDGHHVLAKFPMRGTV